MNAVQQIAVVCHEANRAFCLVMGDDSQLPWNLAPTWQKESAIKGVEFALDNPDAPASAQHDAWSNDKYNDGWVYGEVKDASKKTHPCLIEFADLPPFQQKKDILFKAIVAALR
jgi:hypothetical protein